MIKASFGFSEIPIQLTADSPQVLTCWNAFFCNLALVPIPSPHVISVNLTVERAVPNELRDLVASPPAVTWEGGKQWRQNGFMLTQFRHGAGWVSHDLRKKQVDGAITKEASQRLDLIKVFVFWGLRHTLAVLEENLPKNMTLLHGSAVTREGRALVVVGDSGSGKTSICMSLLERGFSLLSDDYTIVDVSGDLPRVIPFPILAHVDVHIIKRFMPRLATYLAGRSTEESEVIVPAEDLSKVYQVGAKSAQPLSLLAIGEVHADEPTRIEPVRRGELLARMAAATDPFNHRSPGMRFDSLSKVVSGTKHTLTIRSGHDLPETVENIFYKSILSR